MRIISFIIILTSSIYTQSLSDYYPLEKGDKWFYKVTNYDVNSAPSSVSYYSKEVSGDTAMDNGIKYFTILEKGQRHYERFDTLSNEIKYYSYTGCSGNDISKYSLNYKEDSTIVWGSCDGMTYQISFLGSDNPDSSSINLRGDGLIVENISFRKYVGMAGQSFLEGGNSNISLIGYKIHGKEWGILSSADKKSIEYNYRLEQNYPNPFNPSTTISFEIETRSRVRLNIYNLQGRLIGTVLDKELGKGKHSVVFEGGKYASGVYYYQLITNNYVCTKKFILIK